MPKLILAVLVIAGLAFAAIPALADVTVSAEGVVTAIDGSAGTFDLQSDAGDVYTVDPPDDFNLSILTVGAKVRVEGTLAGGVITASAVELAELDDDDDDASSSDNQGFYCRTPSARHPALKRLAQQYNEPYAELLYYFCEWHFGVGEIKLALETAETLNNGTTFGQILELKRETGGWGRVWQHYGMNGGDRAKKNGK